MHTPAFFELFLGFLVTQVWAWWLSKRDPRVARVPVTVTMISTGCLVMAWVGINTDQAQLLSMGRWGMGGAVLLSWVVLGVLTLLLKDPDA